MKREKLASECILCLVKKHVSLENENVKNKAQATLDLLKIVACATLDKGAPEILDEITAYKEQKLGLFEDFSKEKQQFNALMLACEEKLKKQIFSSADQIQAAVKLCLAAKQIHITDRFLKLSNLIMQLTATIKRMLMTEYTKFFFFLKKRGISLLSFPIKWIAL